jgi:hypothetical protein
MVDQEIDDATAARGSAQEREAARFDITIRQASLLFAEFGVPRSPRSVQGFCKDGHIESIRVKGPTGDRYFISRDSIERYATELKQIDEVAKIGAESESAQERELARDSAQQRAEPEAVKVVLDLTNKDKEVELTEAVQQLREENLNLRVDNRGKENFINQLVQDRNQLLGAVQEISYKLGFAESRVQQLEAPKDDPRSSAQEREPVRNDDLEDARVTDAVVVADEDELQRGAANVDLKGKEIQSIAEPPKRSVWNKIFG